MFKEQDVEKVANKILSSTKEKIKEQLADEFYKEMQELLYEHYDNFRETEERKLIKEIADDFARSPREYKYEKLRDKIFQENKETFLQEITEEKIEEAFKKIMWDYTHLNFPFRWKWEERAADFIYQNLETFLDKPVVQIKLLEKIRDLENKVSDYQQKLERVETD